jgi:hypothetical protein
VYDEQLAEEILAKLAAAYPAKLRFADLRSSLPSYRSADDRALLAAIEALVADGDVTCVGLRDGFSGRIEVAENIALSATEWEARRPPRPTDPYPDSAEGSSKTSATGLRVGVRGSPVHSGRNRFGIGSITCDFWRNRVLPLGCRAAPRSHATW